MAKEHLMNTYARYDVVFKKGIGCRLYDENGKEYIDFVSGVAVNCLGHSSSIIIEALNKQSNNLMHISNLYWNEPQMELAEKLCVLSNHDKVFFCNSGTEAVEAALKLSRKYGKLKSSNKNTIIYMKNSFHGRTLGALAVTGQEKYQKNFIPLMEGVKAVNYNDIEDLEKNMDENVCAVILEPIQGEGGIVTASDEFLKKAKELCDKYDALLIFDEVQCGIGRLGTLFAYQSFRVIPDVICMAKGLGGGFPIGAVLANKKAADAFEAGDHGSTFGGNPLACSVALAVLNAIVDYNILDNVNKKSKYIVSRINELKEKYSVIEEIKGKGLLLGIKVNTEPKNINKKAFEKGLLLIGAGSDVVRILPPLNVEKEDVDEAFKILEEVLCEI